MARVMGIFMKLTLTQLPENEMHKRLGLLQKLNYDSLVLPGFSRFAKLTVDIYHSQFNEYSIELVM